MKCELFPFQKNALAQLRTQTAIALREYQDNRTSQVISYTAPTGAGKTIIMSALIEAIYKGDENYPEQTDAIFIWLSDSPQLNEQSKQKIDIMADKIRLDQCVTINDDSFDREILEDGHIYFINTQKLSKSSNLTKHSDSREFTIWETLNNTVREKSDRLYFIIDEAHRGAQNTKDLTRATTIMQKFLKGSPENNLPQMPVIIGMTATWERFNRLAEGINTTTRRVETKPDEVRASGLLKDKIIITYPEKSGNDMSILEAATDEWKNKCDHWRQYCYEQHYKHVNPIFVIQVKNAVNEQHISETDLDECLRIIEERIGEHFIENQVVHAFGEGTSTLRINGLNVPYVEPSRISEDKRIRVVFFKETLTTGWDCPRAETMMSFRHAKDHTYIAQLLGRMIRTPTQQYIKVDETLNNVHLYLPQFNKDTVNDVVEALKSTEGGNIPTDIESEEMGILTYDTLVVRPKHHNTNNNISHKKSHDILPEQTSLFGDMNNNNSSKAANENIEIFKDTKSNSDEIHEQNKSKKHETNSDFPTNDLPKSDENIVPINIDREAIIKAINDSGLLTYNVRVRDNHITNYLRSMFNLARFLTQTKIDINAKDNVISEIIEKIDKFKEKLIDKNQYETLTNQVKSFNMNTQVFDAFGKSIDKKIYKTSSTSDADIDSQFRRAESKLGNEGVGNRYITYHQYYSGNTTNDSNQILSYKIDVILFTLNCDCMDDLNKFSEKKFHELNNNDNRRSTVKLDEQSRKKYDRIVSDGDIISKHNLQLPEIIEIPHVSKGKDYYNHLYVDENSRKARYKLDSTWEEKVIEEEEKRDDFVCWLRNLPRKSWSLCIPYEINEEKHSSYPDFLIIRRDKSGDYIVDILEPHRNDLIDNLGKAKGLAEYARQNPGVGRIQLIRSKKDSLGNERPFRLDMSDSYIRDKVSKCLKIEELDDIFNKNGFFMDIHENK